MFWEFHDIAVKHCHKIPSSHHNLLDHPPPPNTGIITPSYFPRLVGGTPWWRNTWMIPSFIQLEPDQSLVLQYAARWWRGCAAYLRATYVALFLSAEARRWWGGGMTRYLPTCTRQPWPSTQQGRVSTLGCSQVFVHYYQQAIDSSHISAVFLVQNLLFVVWLFYHL